MEVVSKATSFDDLVTALGDVRRRHLLVTLLDADRRAAGPIHVDGDVPETEPEEIGTTMRHIHLPKLAELGLINWDEEQHCVTKGENFDEIKPALQLIREHQDDFPDGWL